jgi:hypothetical protein
MLTKGDLVRVRQDTFLYPVNLEPWFVKRLKAPQYGVVINRATDTETKVFLEEQAWIIDNKCLQLVGEKDVYKTKQDK